MHAKPMRYKGETCRVYHSIFGKFRFARCKYYSADLGSYYPLDALLNLPCSCHSYLLQSWIARAATSEAFEPSLCLLNEVLDQDFKAMTARRISERYGAQVDAYYDQQSPRRAQGAVLGLSCDGKGVRIVRSEREQTPQPDAARLMKGQKRGTKKQATVSVSFSFEPAPRTPEEVAKSLHRRWSPEERRARQAKRQAAGQAKTQTALPGEQPPAGTALDVHRRALMGPQKRALAYGATALKRLDPEDRLPIVVLTDGHRALVKGFPEVLAEAGLFERVEAMILDIIHVSEYLWKCGNALLGEQHPEREAWVYERLVLILESRLEEVIEELSALEQSKKVIAEALGYFRNHRHMMDYRSYLGRGFPISTGLVEGTCGHLVKDRMEGSGMRWSRAGAQHILDTRAVEKNGDWDDFSAFVKEQGQSPIYQMAA